MLNCLCSLCAIKAELNSSGTNLWSAKLNTFLSGPLPRKELASLFYKLHEDRVFVVCCSVLLIKEQLYCRMYKIKAVCQLIANLRFE